MIEPWPDWMEEALSRIAFTIWRKVSWYGVQRDDIYQELWLHILEYRQSEKIFSPKLAVLAAKHDTLDFIVSKKIQDSYAGRFRHFSTEAFLNSAMFPDEHAMPGFPVIDNPEPTIVHTIFMEDLWVYILDYFQGRFSKRDIEIFQAYYKEGLKQVAIEKTVSISRSMIAKVLGKMAKSLREHMANEENEK